MAGLHCNETKYTHPVAGINQQGYLHFTFFGHITCFSMNGIQIKLYIQPIVQIWYKHESTFKLQIWAWSYPKAALFLGADI